MASSEKHVALVDCLESQPYMFYYLLLYLLLLNEKSCHYCWFANLNLLRCDGQELQAPTKRWRPVPPVLCHLK